MKSPFLLVPFLLFPISGIALEPIYYEEFEELTTAAFGSIVAQAAAEENENFQLHIRTRMGLEEESDIDDFRQYLAAVANRINEDNLADRERYLCRGPARPQGDELLIRVNQVQDTVQVNQRNHYLAVQEELDADTWNKFEAWVHTVAEGTTAWKYRVDETDIDHIKSSTDDFCSLRGY